MKAAKLSVHVVDHRNCIPRIINGTRRQSVDDRSYSGKVTIEKGPRLCLGGGLD